MKKRHMSAFRRVLAVALTVAMLFNIALALPVVAAENDSGHRVGISLVDSDYRPDMRLQNKLSLPTAGNIAEEYAPDDIVRVSIVLDSKSTLEMGYSTIGIAQNEGAMSYRKKLQKE